MAENEPHDHRTRTFVSLISGTAVSHYKIIEKIGSGGMGEVYLALDTKLNRKVALKFLPPHLCQDDDCRKRFTREAQAAAGLDHPNIAGIYEVGDYNGRPFFAMQVVEGQSLREVVTGRELPVDRILEIAIQICEGLQAAHDKGIIHRDIKPSNILIDSHSRVRIVDFGLASVQGSEHLTKTGSTLGTIGYMSPEQVRGQETDHRSDLFSLGVVLYELITKQSPFKRDSDAATLKAVSDDMPEPMARFKTGLPDGLQAIVDKALDKDVKTRYQHADGMLSDLMRLKRSADSQYSTASIAPTAGSSKWAWWTGAALVVIAAAVVLMLTKPWVTESATDQPDKIMLVVLPFENLGNEEDEYFADGMTDEITARLAGFSGLGVISRTSAVHYKGSGKSLKQIASELDVEYVLEGTIRWDKSGDTERVRIIPQLIRASDDSHVWASTFERALTQVFAVQADIATLIAEALDVTLLESEKQLLAAEPTDNLGAYDFYLRGKEYWDSDRDSDLAIEMFEKAVALDSNFYPAYAWLAQLYGYEYINDIRLTEERKVRAREAADKAFELADGKPDGYMALGYYHYYISRDYDRALEFFQQALIGQPNNSELIAAVGYVQRRQGNWNAAVTSLRRSIRLNPLSLGEITGLTVTLMRMHRIEEAEGVVTRALELAPDNSGLLFFKVVLSFYSGRDSSVTIAAKREYERNLPAQAAASVLETSDIIRRDYDSALGRQTIPTRPTASDSVSFYMQRGHIYRFMADSGVSRAYFDSARIVCEARVRTDPEVGLFRASLAEAYAGTGQTDKAIQEGELAAELLPVSKDEMLGADVLHKLAMVYTMVGEYGLAIDQLDYLLSHPSMVQIQTVRRHPIYDPLRDHPRFQALLEKYERR